MALLIMCAPPVSGASPGSCGSVFISKNAARLELQQILRENYDINPRSLLQKMILKYSARRLHKAARGLPRELQEAMVQIDNLVQIAERLASGAERGTSLEKAWVRREVLSRSVIEILQSYGHEPAATQNVLKRIFSNRAVRFLLNPAELPFVADRQIPPAILEKMLREGPESVRPEIQNFYQSQSQHQVDTYRSVASLYKWVALVIFTTMAWDQYEDYKNEKNEEKKSELTKSLDGLDEMLSVLDEEFERRGLYKN